MQTFITWHNINIITTIKSFSLRALFAGEGDYFIKKARQVDIALR